MPPPTPCWDSIARHMRSPFAAACRYVAAAAAVLLIIATATLVLVARRGEVKAPVRSDVASARVKQVMARNAPPDGLTVSASSDNDVW